MPPLTFTAYSFGQGHLSAPVMVTLILIFVQHPGQLSCLLTSVFPINTLERRVQDLALTRHTFLHSKESFRNMKPTGKQLRQLQVSSLRLCPSQFKGVSTLPRHSEHQTCMLDKDTSLPCPPPSEIHLCPVVLTKIQSSYLRSINAWLRLVWFSITIHFCGVSYTRAKWVHRLLFWLNSIIHLLCIGEHE